MQIKNRTAPLSIIRLEGGHSAYGLDGLRWLGATWFALGMMSWTASATSLSDPTAVSVAGFSAADMQFAHGNSASSEVSGDGRYVLFVSDATDITTNGATSFLDIYLRDRELKRTELISANTNRVRGNQSSGDPQMSADRHWVVFQSGASDLVAHDTNSETDIFLRDREAGQTRLVSVNRFGSGPGNARSQSPIMTPDGRYVVFESAATDLVELTDTNRAPDIFVRDLQAGITELVSVNASGTAAAGKVGNYAIGSLSAMITLDGRYVAFVSEATNLVANGRNRGREVFVRDRQTGVTLCASSNAWPDFTGAIYAANPALSGNGRYLAFSATQTGVSDRSMFYCDLQTSETFSITASTPASSDESPDFAGPILSDDGRYVVYVTRFQGTNQVYRWDGQTKSNLLVSVGTDGASPGNAHSDSPHMTPDGRRVAFVSLATNLVEAATANVYQVYARDMVAGQTILASLTTEGSAAEAGDWAAPIISDNGEWIVMDTADGMMMPGDDNEAFDVFIRAWNASTLELVSQRDPGVAAVTPNGLSSGSANTLDRDGRFVTFYSLASNLVTNDVNGTWDVFLRDTLLEKTCLVSQSTNGAQTANDASSYPSISGDGNWIAFESLATDLAGPDPQKLSDIFLHNRNSNSNQLISFNRITRSPANGASSGALVTSDGRYVIYKSQATDLTADVVSLSKTRLYAFDVLGGTNFLVSYIATTNIGVTNLAVLQGTVLNYFVSSDGRFVAGTIAESSFSSGQYSFVYDLANRRSITSRSQGYIWAITQDGRVLLDQKANDLVAVDLPASTEAAMSVSNFNNITVSGDGQWLAYESKPNAAQPKRQVYVYSSATKETRLISAASDGAPGNADSRGPIVDPAGRYVAFSSWASNLVVGDNNELDDVFLYDLQQGTLQCVSFNLPGTGTGNSQSVLKAVSPDGQAILFDSFASDLVSGDNNVLKDVFLSRVAPLDSDQDGLPDVWELAQFGNLDQTGSDDPDHDGLDNLAEYGLGTNPNQPNANPLLKVVGLTQNDQGQPTLYWSSQPGHKYRLQYKNSLSQEIWEDVPGDITAVNPNSSKIDDTLDSPATRFYRIIEAP